MTSHLMVSNDAAYVLDCGLGVTNQFARTGIPFNKLRSIFITHHHPDHNVEYGTLLVIGWVQGMPLTVTRVTRMYGPAVRSKKILTSWRRAVLHQCIRPLIGALLRAIMDISARPY
jgi:ribonuclease BN (tRNA processing enzyme)